MKKIFLWISIALLSSCSKQEILSKSTTETKSTSAALAATGKITPNFLPGTCPYDCHDIRCKNYYQGYCGITSDTIIIKMNPNNPNDFVGTIHNNGCNYILPKISFSSSSVYSDLLYQDKVFVQSNGYDSASVSKAYLGGQQKGYLYNPDSVYTNNPTLLINKLYSDGSISLTAKNYFNTIFSYLSNIIGNNSPSSTVYNSFANNLITLENQIQSSSSSTTNERSILLSSCSVDRNSAGYWGEYVLSGNGNSSGASTNKFSLFGIHINWHKVIGADVTGAIGGFFGSLFTGGGLIAGTVGGAIGGSVGEIVIENTGLGDNP